MGQILLVKKIKLNILTNQGLSPYFNYFIPSYEFKLLKKKYKKQTRTQLELIKKEYKLAARVVNIRSMGKAYFLELQDSEEKMQAFINQKSVGKKCYYLIKLIDVGDFLGIKGRPFKTKTNNLTI